MSDRPAPAHRGIAPGQVAEIIVSLHGDVGRRGSGYRVGPTAVLTVAHVIEGAMSVRVRFDADLPGEWSTEVTSCWTDPRSDLAVLTITPRQDEPPTPVARFGRISDRAAVLAVRAVGFPRFKLKTDHDDPAVYRDSHQTDGSVALLSNRREGTLEVTVPPPDLDADPVTSPWEGMSGAAAWVGDRIVGVIAKHHRSDGPGRLAAARLDLALDGLDASRRTELQALLGLPDVLPDAIPASTGERVPAAYQAQVRVIAPDRLLDRDAELDELVGFCAGDQPYAWWQAGPWAGKSALMSWFALHPPDGVEVVSFFITAQLAVQSDSDACTTALIDQLAALLGESPVSLPAAGARQGTMLELLRNAANRSREAGRRLLLLIDGLDEDSGTGLSIAALLPRRPPPEVRVLVASRPHPPIPDDVAGDHPLRTITPRQLAVWEHAPDVERRAKHELTQLLTGSQLQRDVLGLITASGGGLTLGDLEELAKRPYFEIEHLLSGVFGRSVGSRISSLAVGRHPDESVYLFTHETLRLVAEQQFGNSLTAYQGQLHAWAGTWLVRGWTANTPQYLLRSYPRMLASTGNLSRLVALAIDPARHDRMRDLTGGDALAFTEISTAQQLILAQPDPDLASLALLAVQREHLTDRNRFIPTNLPPVWAMLGQPTRAEALANSIPDPDKRAQALSRLVEVTAECGDRDRAARLVSTIEALTVQIADPVARAQAVGRLAVVMGRSGDRNRAARLAEEIVRLADEAETLITQITDLIVQGMALCGLVEAVAGGGDYDRAETLTTQITEPGLRAEALGRLATLMATGGDRTRGGQFAIEAEALIGQITDPDWRAGALCQLAEAASANDDCDRAAHLLSEVEALTEQFAGTYEPDQAEVLCQLANAMAISGDQDRAARLSIEAEAFTEQITSPYERAEVLCQLAEMAVAGGDRDRTARLISEVEALTERITDPYPRVPVLMLPVDVVAAGDDYDRAEVLDTQFIYPGPWGRVLRWLADVVAANGDYDRAEVLVTQIPDPGLRARALGRLAEAIAEGNEHNQAARLVNDAEALTAQLTDPYDRALALSQLAAAVFAGGEEGQAIRLADEAEAFAAQVTRPRSQDWVFVRLAELAVAGCDYDRADGLIAQIAEPGPRAGTLGQLAEAVAADGDQGQAARLISEAEALTDRITNHYQRAEALAGLAVTLRRTAENTALAREHPHKSSHALVRSRSLFAEALVIGSWRAVVFDLALVDPSAVSALADELEVRLKLDAPGRPEHNIEQHEPG